MMKGTNTFKTSPAQRAAAKRYQQKHKEQQRKYSYKASGKQFILKYATLKDLDQVKEWISQREKELKDNTR